MRTHRKQKNLPGNSGLQNSGKWPFLTEACKVTVEVTRIWVDLDTYSMAGSTRRGCKLGLQHSLANVPVLTPGYQGVHPPACLSPPPSHIPQIFPGDGGCEWSMGLALRAQLRTHCAFGHPSERGDAASVNPSQCTDQGQTGDVSYRRASPGEKQSGMRSPLRPSLAHTSQATERGFSTR